jgi:HK97 gp10 family phage protein
MSKEVDVKGLTELLEELDGIADPVNMEAALQKACALVERAAKEKAPKGTGELRRSITSRIEGDKGIVFTPLEYAPYVEYGTGLFAEGEGRADVPWSYQDEEGNWHTTSGMKPQPYLRPALNENREQIKRILKGGLKKRD